MFNMKSGVRFLGHPLHALIIHFPMGLLPITLLWDILALWTREAFWWDFSFWSIIVGLSFAVIAAIPGFVDFISIPEHHSAEKPALIHMSVILVALCFYIGSLLCRIHGHSLEGIKMFGAVGFSILGLVCLVVGGWYGGELVFRHQVGGKNLDKEV